MASTRGRGMAAAAGLKELTLVRAGTGLGMTEGFWGKLRKRA